jgi:hypothetical protein
MVAAIVSKSAYAAHRSVTAACVTMWIGRQKLTAPALLPDGRIDVALADQQLPSVARRSPGGPRGPRVIRRKRASEASGDPPGGQPPVAVDDAEAADRLHGRDRPPGDRHDRQETIVVVIDELPGLAQRLRLHRGQISALNRWFLGRRTA